MLSLYSGLKRVRALENEGSLVLQQLALFSRYPNLCVSFHFTLTHVLILCTMSLFIEPYGTNDHRI